MMKHTLEFLGIYLIVVLIIFITLYAVGDYKPRSLQAIRMNENTVQIMYTPNKPVYVTCYSDDVLLECVDAPTYGRITYTTNHVASEYSVKVYYQDGSVEENRITVQVP